tara:strand:- start:1767 stop:1931 length:165 start_codon:yes stop_codon:yes gene_type:complete
MIELKKCPFCGGLTQMGGFMVGCLKCKVSFKFDPRIKGGINEAIKQWNKRVANN